MADVFILGAGFSKAVHSSVPLLDELTNIVRERLGPSLPEWLLKIGNNVEDWLTYLSQPQPWLTENDSLVNRALFLRLTEAIDQAISTVVSVVNKCRY